MKNYFWKKKIIIKIIYILIKVKTKMNVILILKNNIWNIVKYKLFLAWLFIFIFCHVLFI